VSLVAAILLAISTFLLVPQRPEPRLRRLVGAHPRARPTMTSTQIGFGTACVVAIAGVSLFGVLPGCLLGLAGFVLMPVVLGRLEPAEARRHRQALERQLPDAIDVLTSVLDAGAPPASALHAVGRALGSPIGGELERVAKALSLGASAGEAWSSAHTAMKPIAVAMSRSAETGAPLSRVLAGASRDARREHRVRVEIAARSAGVRAVAPLAACFLPAFFLMGVAPIIASFVDQMLTA